MVPTSGIRRLDSARTGKACLYLKRLDDIDLEALRDLIRAAWSARPSWTSSGVAERARALGTI
jgi:hypothetical protein